MATYHAIYATSEAICNILRQPLDPEEPDADMTGITCNVFSTSDFGNAIPENGEIALFPYRVNIDSVQRTLPAFPRYNGIKERHHLPLELHFLLIPRAQTAQQQLSIMGWMMRVIEDNTSLPATLLNRSIEEVFSDDEHIEVTPTQLTTEEILRLWDQLPSDFNISVPYCARLLRIESPVTTDEGQPVLQRDLDFRG